MSETGLPAGTLAPGTLALILALTSAAIHALLNVFIKGAGDPLARRAGMNVVAAVVMAPVVFLAPLPTPDAWFHLGLGVAIHVIYQLAQLQSYKHGDLSVAHPVARGIGVGGAAILALVWAGEGVTTAQALGLALAAGAIMAFGLLAGRAHTHSLVWAAITGCFIAAYTVNDAQGVRAATTGLSYLAWFFLLDAVGLSAVAVARRGEGLTQIWRADLRGTLLGGLCILGTYSTYLFALRLAPIGATVAARESAVILTALLGWLVFGERLGPWRLVAAGVLAAGLGVVQIAR